MKVVDTVENDVKPIKEDSSGTIEVSDVFGLFGANIT